MRDIAQWHVVPGKDVPGAGLDIQVDQSDQHEYRTKECVEEELDGCIDPIRPTPYTNHQEHRDQHGFKEHIKKQTVECGEHTDHQTFHDQECGHILADVFLNRTPTGNDHQNTKEQR